MILVGTLSLLLREFQIYTKMRKIARQIKSTARYSDGLEGIVNPHVYSGPISGVANADTRVQLMNWVDHSFRCPVVVECWTMRRGQRAAIFSGPANTYATSSQNLWAYNEVPQNAPRMFARDFTDHYSVPASRTTDETTRSG